MGGYPRTDKLSSDDEKNEVFVLSGFDGTRGPFGDKVSRPKGRIICRMGFDELGSDEGGEIHKSFALDQMKGENCRRFFFLIHGVIHTSTSSSAMATRILVVFKRTRRESSFFDSELTATPPKETEAKTAYLVPNRANGKIKVIYEE